MGDRQADFDAELVGVASLAFGDAFHLRRVQRVELVLAGALLSSDALGALQPHGQIAQGLRAVRLARRCTACGHRRLIRIDLALHLAHHHAEDRALALDGLAQALELFEYAMPPKNCHCTFSAQRSTNSSSLRLKLR